MTKLNFEELENKIKAAYEEGVTIEQAERLAAEFLYAQTQIVGSLQNADLDARMRKSGTKALKAAVYLDNATKGDKKPSDVLLGALVDSNELVQKEQQGLDDAEVTVSSLNHYYSIFKEAHIFFRGIAKGRFE